MHDCAAEHPPRVGEVEQVGFTTLPGIAVRPSRIAETPVALECTLCEKVETASRKVFVGQLRWLKLRWLQVRDGLVDTQTWRVRTEDRFPVGRFGADLYVKTRDRCTTAGFEP